MTHKQYTELMAAKNGPVKVPRPVKMQPPLPPSVFEGERIVVVLPLPDRGLHPNSSNNGHWSKKSELIKSAKHEAKITTMKALKGARPLWDKTIGFRRVYLTTRARADKDNLAGWTKAYVDGITDAGVMVNDCGITWQADEIGADRTMPRVEIELRKA